MERKAKPNSTETVRLSDYVVIYQNIAKKIKSQQPTLIPREE